MSLTAVPPLLPDYALPFPHILRVRASAGSGKTYILALRFTQFLLSRRIPRSLPENILAITFTRAAAAEMRSRALRRLKEAALGKATTVKELASLVSIQPKDIPEEAKRVVDELVLRYDSFQAGTIDSLIARIVRACALELGLSPALETETHTDPFTISALDRMLLAAGSDPGLFNDLADFAIHYLDFEGKGGWWPRSFLHREFVQFLEMETRLGKELEGGRPPRTEALLEALRREAARFLDLIEGLGIATQLKKHDQACLEKVANEDDPSFSSKTWEKVSARDLFKKACDVPDEVEEAWRRLRGRAGTYALAHARKRPLPYIRLFLWWKKELADLKEKRKTLFLGDMNLLARGLAGGLHAFEVSFRLGERINHVLVDEFQDTSDLQWENLRFLLEEALSAGGSLFSVGDPKQILYRWRGSDARIFDEAPKGFSSIAPGHLLDLDLKYNWRSRRVILDFVAELFSPSCLMAADGLVRDLGDSEARNLADTFTSAAQSVPPGREETQAGGYVYVEKTMGSTDAPPWERLVGLLKKDILTRWPPGDVMVLLRRNEDVEEATAALLAAGIPTVSERLLDVRSDPIVKEILSFLLFLDQPEDIYLTAVLSGLIAEKAWREHGPDGISPEAWIESVASRQKRHLSLKNVLKQEIPGLWKALFHPFDRGSGPCTVYDLASRMVKMLEIPERFPESWPSIRRLLAVMHEMESELGGDITAFLGWIGEAPKEGLLLPKPEDAQSVQVMTIHKAKGLESPVVVLPKAAIGPRVGGMLYDETQNGIRLWQVKKEFRKVSRRLAMLHQTELRKAWKDELNVFYVAVTRAREELYLLVPPKVGSRTNGLTGLMAQIAGGETASFERGKRLGRKMPCRAADGQKRPAERAPAQERTERRPWEALLVRHDDAGLNVFFPTRQKAIRSGEAVHQLLARLSFALTCPPEIDPLVAVLSDMIEPHERDKIPPEAVMRIASSLLLTEARPLFWPTETARIFTEKEIADANGGLFRIDRLVVTDQEVYACEYKTGEGPRGRDAEQIFRYLELLSSLYQDRSVSGLLLYVDIGLARRVFASCPT